ncbi:hypothetical protein DMH04_27165 [Kibdelosporangium aridum]|uniref:Uncharacterized protein n=1 Tax=Kibdelosporangium aridum TaxID=2030 RepID=A0A428Z4K8_KIBAR|nr:hypothetical protein DMH04_27165 [Kibdelosporangium aridum]
MIALMAVCGLVFVAQPAAAATPNWFDIKQDGYGAQLAGRIDWIDANRFNVHWVRLYDKARDNEPVFWVLEINPGWTSSWYGTKRFNHGGYNTNRYWGPGDGIHAIDNPINHVRIWVCVGNTLTFGNCRSDTKNNPYYP